MPTTKPVERPRPVRRRLARADRRTQLLDVADELFSARGIQATSMEDIAEQAGVTKPVVYDHFGSKDGLLAAIITRAGNQLAETVLEAVSSADSAEDALASGVRAYFRFIAARGRGWTTLIAGTAGTSSVADGAGGAGAGNQAVRALEKVREQQSDLIAHLIREDIPDCEPAR